MTFPFPGRLFRSRRPHTRRSERSLRAHHAHRPLRFQSLEQRRLLAAYINELMVDPLFTGNDVGQYLEIRAEPDSTLADGTYFVAVNERGLGGLGSSVGVIHGIFDLSGQAVGSNGMLVVLQQNSPFQLSQSLVPDGPGPAVLQSTARGFSGLPGNLFSSLGADNSQIDSIVGSNGYFLIQTDVPPELGQDIDTDDDGLIDPDGVAATWNILDSISLHHGVFRGPVGYGQIVFVEMQGQTLPQVSAAEGVEVIHTPGFGYAARIGDSTGYSGDDWVAGTVRDMASGGQAADFRLETGMLGTPVPPVFAGRRLDHLGESNFVAAVRGTLTEEFEDENGELTTRPFSGVTFLADTNGNDSRDLLTHVVEPDNYISGTDLTNTFPGVTLRSVGAQNADQGFTIRATRLPGLNEQNLVFSHTGITSFNDNRRLRADYYRPVSSVSIDILADGSSRPTIGRLEAYNAQGELLQVVRSRPLFGSGRQTITVSVPGEQIAYTVAYSDSNPANFAPGQEASSPSGRLDRLVFRQYEAMAVSDENGEFKLDALQPGVYNIVLQQQSDVQLRDPLPSQRIVIDRYENFRMDLLLRRNSPPRVEPAHFTIPEHSPVDTHIGTVIATDQDEEQTLSFALAEDENSPVWIDPQTGDLFVRDPDQLDFETDPQVVVEVLVSDSVGAVTSGWVVIDLIDIDEPPVVTLRQYSVYEDANPGSPVGRILAFDPDNPESPVRFTIVGGSGMGAFAIGESSGVMTVLAPDLIDFSQDRVLTLSVEVADFSEPPMVTTIEVPITVNDANDPPMITTASMEIAEDAPIGATVGTVQFVDRDLNQSHIFRIIGHAGPFAIDTQSGAITVAAGLDYDTVQHYDLTVQVVDNGIPPMGNQRTIRVDVLPVDRPPTLVLSTFSVDENSPAGTLVGNLVAQNRHGQEGFGFRSSDALDPLSLFEGKVVLDPVTGSLRVAIGAELDFESGQTQLVDQVVVTVDDQPVAVRDVVLEILDVNEPPVIRSTRLDVPQGLPAGRPFTEIDAFDPEGDAITLELVQGAERGLRIIDGNRLMILPGSELDLDEPWPIEAVIRATDAHGLSSVTSLQLVRGEPLRFGASIDNIIGTTGQLLNFALPVEYRGDQIRSLRVVSPTGALPAGISFDPSSGRLSGVPMPQPASNLQLKIEVVEFDGEVEILKQEGFQLAILQSATPLHNHLNPLDVDGNGRIEPIDALRVLNVIAAHGESDAAQLADSVQFFVDTIGDNRVEPLDALRVLNHLARRSMRAESEGESALFAGGLSTAVVDRHARNANDDAIGQWLHESSLF